MSQKCGVSEKVAGAKIRHEIAFVVGSNEAASLRLYRCASCWQTLISREAVDFTGTGLRIQVCRQDAQRYAGPMFGLTLPVRALTILERALTIPMRALTFIVSALTIPVRALTFPVRELTFPVRELTHRQKGLTR